MPPILSISHCEFNGTRSYAHAQKTIPLAPIHLFTKQVITLLCPESLTASCFNPFHQLLATYIYVAYKPLPSLKKHFYSCIVFLWFSLHTFSWACESLQILFLCIPLFVPYLSHFLCQHSPMLELGDIPV